MLTAHDVNGRLSETFFNDIGIEIQKVRLEMLFEHIGYFIQTLTN